MVWLSPSTTIRYTITYSTQLLPLYCIIATHITATSWYIDKEVYKYIRSNNKNHNGIVKHSFTPRIIKNKNIKNKIVYNHLIDIYIELRMLFKVTVFMTSSCPPCTGRRIVSCICLSGWIPTACTTSLRSCIALLFTCTRISPLYTSISEV